MCSTTWRRRVSPKGQWSGHRGTCDFCCRLSGQSKRLQEEALNENTLCMRCPTRVEDMCVVVVSYWGREEEQQGVDCQKELAEHVGCTAL